MRNREYIGVRIDKILADKAQDAAETIGPGISRNYIIEEAARAVLDMIDHPETRVLPKIVRIVDEAKAATDKPLPLKRTNSGSTRQPSAKAVANQQTRSAGRASKRSSRKS